MSVSLYYRATRATPPTPAEAAEVERVLAAREVSFPHADEESLFLYDSRRRAQEEILAGATKLPSDPHRQPQVIAHVLASLTQLRRALPDSGWHVHMDDLDIPWEEPHGYTLPGIADPPQRRLDP
ncbi:hypothetical protein [Streptomyces profundus]|uniref:hypothetical protein n=1 Tax=Streptomyces profundus TaxID=2867410 RepID=UPI001D1679BA|nr:hypothetical protein [Streptomyces sp. MA3_2.13]UED84489.1 hypothetical protein K4G22_09965 [Streptomyces sp. MA3_2.13]